MPIVMVALKILLIVATGAALFVLATNWPSRLDLRVLTYGEGLRLDDWPKALAKVRRTPDVVAAAPFVMTQGLISAGHDYAEGGMVIGVEADTGAHAVTSL